jgi:ComF family protein
MRRAESFWTFCSDFFFPRRCGLCRRLGDDFICSACRTELVPDDRPGASIPDVDLALSVFRYEGRAAQAVRQLKYGRVTSLAAPMGEIMKTALETQELAIDRVIPVPIHFTRRCTRGFNQSELLCDSIEIPRAQRSLLRIRRTPPQVGLSHDRRRTNLIGAFRAMPEVAGQRILLVDDVITTGTTARECARMLRQAGAARIYVLAFARS